MVACFLTPDVETSPYTHPPELKDEIARVVGRYLIDVPDFRTEEKDRLLGDLEEMTDKRFRLAEHLLETRPWDLFFMVEMGTDRIHHAFWRFTDPEHRLFEPGNRYETAILDYYRRLDERIGRLLRHADEETAVLIVSDHGAKRIDGGICVNEWLRQEGYLVLKEEPDGPIAADAGPGRLAAHGRLGRGRLLLPALPERAGARAGGRRPRGRLRARPG